MRHNPLIPALLQILHDHLDGVSEYRVIQLLEGHSGFSSLAEEDSLSLFQQHFMVMNGLYHLQRQLWDDESLLLEISPLCIKFSDVAHKQSAGTAALAETANLGEYYLDWENFEEMDEAGVESLLEQFWQRYLVDGRREPALRTLGLSADFSQMELKRRYRQLATEHHPDKGGDPEQFISIRQAYEVLIA